MKDSFKETVRLAEKGLTPYQIQLGQSYLTGKDFVDGGEFPQDFLRARQWLQRAHEQGAFTATYILGTIYEDGKGVPIDIPKAIALYELAAERGAYLPCINLARIYASGNGVTQSTQLAVRWYQKILSFGENMAAVEETNEARNYLLKNDRRK